MKSLKFVSLLSVLMLYSNLSLASWGLSPEFVVHSCLPKAVGKCEEFRGRANQTNGSAALVIWKVGTKRIIAMGGITPEANDLIKDKLDFSYTIYADFMACPMEKDIPGHRIEYCVESMKKLKWVKTE